MLCLVLVFVSSTVGWTQNEKGKIQGTVKDRQGAVISGATVILVNLTTLHCQKASTVEDGAYSFQELKPGKYQVLVGATYFETQVRIFKLKPGKAVEFSPTLDVSSDGVIVD
jgi:hypothetical protein